MLFISRVTSIFYFDQKLNYSENGICCHLKAPNTTLFTYHKHHIIMDLKFLSWLVKPGFPCYCKHQIKWKYIITMIFTFSKKLQWLVFYIVIRFTSPIVESDIKHHNIPPTFLPQSQRPVTIIIRNDPNPNIYFLYILLYQKNFVTLLGLIVYTCIGIGVIVTCPCDVTIIFHRNLF